jgi:hypothetical protein
MTTIRRKIIIATALVCTLAFLSTVACAADPLPSWNDSASKKAIIAFVEKCSKEGTPDFVPVAERIAVFDNDGTLWAEQPMYFQAFFTFDRIRALAPQHPEWTAQEPFASVLKGDVKTALADGERALGQLFMATHAGTTTDEFSKIVSDWIATAKHPKTGRLLTEMVYQPMLEVLAYLRANGFKTFIVSGGGIEFMRPWSERIYGIPPEQVIGSSIKTKYEMRDGHPVLVRLPEMNFVDDGPGKPVGIQMHIGRRPIAAFGNSNGDREMLEWTKAGDGARLMMLVYHDDAEREWAYGAESKIGTFSDSLMDEAKKNGWMVVSIKNDWQRVFAFNSAEQPDRAKTPVAASSVFQKLVGKWLRPDGGYVIEVKSVDKSGKMDASYYNPKSIHVSKAQASREGTTTKVFIELRDVNYPGSTYNLTYDPQSDQLQGIYYQAAMRESFEVFFTR